MTLHITGGGESVPSLRAAVNKAAASLAGFHETTHFQYSIMGATVWVEVLREEELQLARDEVDTGAHWPKFRCAVTAAQDAHKIPDPGEFVEAPEDWGIP